MLRESSYADLTVRAVAARAKVAPATAYTYFSSKNHLIAEVYLDLVRQVPYFTDVNDSMTDAGREGAARPDTDDRRRARGRGRMHDGTAQRQRPGGAHGPRSHRRRDPPPHPLRDRPGRRRSPVSALEMTYFGALVTRAAAPSPTTRSPTDSATWSASSWEKTDDSSMSPTTCPRPVRLRLPRGSVPVLQAAARRGAALPQRGARLLGAVAARATCCRGSATARRCPTATASRSTRCRAVRTRRRPCRSWRWTIPAHLRLRTLVSKGFTPRRIRELEPRVTELAVQHLERCSRRPAGAKSSTT